METQTLPCRADAPSQTESSQVSTLVAKPWLFSVTLPHPSLFFSQHITEPDTSTEGSKSEQLGRKEAVRLFLGFFTLTCLFFVGCYLDSVCTIVQNTGRPVFHVLSVFLMRCVLHFPLSYCFLFLCHFFFSALVPSTVCQGGCVFLWLPVHVKITWWAKKYESSTQLNSVWVVILQTSNIFRQVMTKFLLNERQHGRNVKIARLLAGLQRKYAFKFVFAVRYNHENWFKKLFADTR